MDSYNPGAYILLTDPSRGDSPLPGIIFPDDFAKEHASCRSQCPSLSLVLIFGPPHKFQWANRKYLSLLALEACDLYRNHSIQCQNAFATARLSQELGMGVNDWKNNLVGDEVFEDSTFRAPNHFLDRNDKENEIEEDCDEVLKRVLHASLAEQSQIDSDYSSSRLDEDHLEGDLDESEIDTFGPRENIRKTHNEVSVTDVRRIWTPIPNRAWEGKGRVRRDEEQSPSETWKVCADLEGKGALHELLTSSKRAWKSESGLSNAKPYLDVSEIETERSKRRKILFKDKRGSLKLKSKNVMDGLNEFREGMRALTLTSDAIDESSDNDIFAYVYVGPKDEEFRFLRKDLEDRPYFFYPRAGVNRLQKVEISIVNPEATSNEERNDHEKTAMKMEIRWILAHPALKSIDPSTFKLVAQFLSSGTFGHCRPETPSEFESAFTECVDVLQVADLLSMSDLLDAVGEKVDRFLPYWDSWFILVFARRLYESQQIAFPEFRRIKRALVSYIVEEFRRYMEDDGMRPELLDMLEEFPGLNFDFTMVRLAQMARERPEQDIIGDHFEGIEHDNYSDNLEEDAEAEDAEAEGNVVMESDLLYGGAL